MEYKDMKEKFMHSNGTSAYETNSVIIPPFLLTFLAATLSTMIMVSTGSEKQSSGIKQFLLEFVVLIIPIILCITVLVPYMNEVTVALFVISVTLCFIVLRLKPNEKTRTKVTAEVKRGFVTNVRSSINLISVIAILAVDFHVFPRYFTKTETYGYSLMDVGVGLFVFSNGIVAPEIRGHKNSLMKNFRSTIPLFVIGGARFFITKQVDYHVPVSEYGLHWNFFITLAMLKVLSSLVLTVVPIKYAMFTGAFLLFVHETLLQLGLAQYVFSNIERNSFLTANREGVVSALGYVGLYFLSVAFGAFIGIKNENFARNKWNLFGKLSIGAAVLMWATRVLEKNFGISRRLANSGYCIWIMFIGVFQINIFFMGEVVHKYIFAANKIMNTAPVPIVFEAISYNGLAFFLLANILTGYINIIVDTMTVQPFMSLVIITGYTFINCFVIFTMYHKKLKLKL